MKNDTPLAEARRRWDELFTKLTNDREWCKTQRFFHENLFDVYDMIVESREFRLMEKKSSLQDVVFQLSHLDWN